jgi:hypothetical protein
MSQAQEEGKSSYQGRSCKLRASYIKKSAEAILVGDNELRKETAEDSQNDEGLNIKMFQMQQGGYTSLVISGTE